MEFQKEMKIIKIKCHHCDNWSYTIKGVNFWICPPCLEKKIDKLDQD